MSIYSDSPWSTNMPGQKSLNVMYKDNLGQHVPVYSEERADSDCDGTIQNTLDLVVRHPSS